MEKFQLFNADTLVLESIYERTLTGDRYSEVVVHEQNQLPIRLKNKCDEAHLQDWIERRSIPVIPPCNLISTNV